MQSENKSTLSKLHAHQLYGQFSDNKKLQQAYAEERCAEGANSSSEGQSTLRNFVMC